MCHFVLVFFSPFSIAITSLGEKRANLSAFRTFVRFLLVWICRFPFPLGVWEELRFVIVALPGLFSYLVLWTKQKSRAQNQNSDQLFSARGTGHFSRETSIKIVLYSLLKRGPL